MAANVAPIYPLTPRFLTQRVNAANTALDGTGTVTTIGQAGANGSIIRALTAIARATTTVGAIRIFTSTTGAASSWNLWLDGLLPAATIANTTADAGTLKLIDPTDSTTWRVIAANLYIGVTEAVANDVQVNAELMDY